VPRADVLLIDDTWVSGASAQSAAAALKLAGARRVAIVVLGRHLDPADPRAGQLVARLRPGPYDPSKCAVHPQLNQGP
jgi:adenine/guanine phosphoribosyltransferase-like PRPP-binding protein